MKSKFSSLLAVLLIIMLATILVACDDNWDGLDRSDMEWDGSDGYHGPNDGLVRPTPTVAPTPEVPGGQ